MAHSVKSFRHLVYIVSNMTYPPAEGQHANHCLLMRSMRTAGHNVSLIAMVRNRGDLNIDALCESVGGLANVIVIDTMLNYPLLLIRHLFFDFGSSKLRLALKEIISRTPNLVIHLEGIGLVPMVATLKNHAVVVTTTDAWSLRQQRLAPLMKFWHLRKLVLAYSVVSRWVERRYFALAGAVQVVSPVDADYLRQTVPCARIHAIPIFLDLIGKSQDKTPLLNKACPATILFWGDIRVPHISYGLLWLLREVVPLVVVPAKWIVLGRSVPDQRMKALAPDVEFITWVPDIDQLLRSASIVVLPDVQGSGLKNRAVHAMGCGVPVVGTPAAFEGFSVVDELDAMVKGDAAGFAGAVNRLLGDDVLSARMGQQGRRFAIEGYGVEAVAKRWADLYASVQPHASFSR